MNNITKIIILSAILPASVFAANTPWTNEVELGFLLNRGNTHNTHFDSRFTNTYNAEKWNNTFSVASLVDLGLDNNTREKQKTAEKYNLNNNVKLNFTTNDYMFTEIDGERDKFSAFDYEVSESIGYGRRLINTDVIKLNVEAGPGGHHSRSTRADRTRFHQDEVIGHFASVVKYAISDTAEFSENLSYDLGSNLQKTKSTTALKAKIYDAVSLKLSYIVEYNAKLPETGKDQDHTDSTTALTVAYMF